MHISAHFLFYVVCAQCLLCSLFIRRADALIRCLRAFYERFEQLTLCVICYFSDMDQFLKGYFSVIVKMSYDSIIGPVSTILAMAEGMLTLIWTALVSATLPLSFLGSSVSPRAR